MRKLIPILLLAIVITINFTTVAYASENDEKVEKGSITVQFTKANEDLDIMISKVADMVNGEYVLTEDYKDTNVDLNEVKDANSMMLLDKKLEKVKVDGIVKNMNANGEVVFDNLEKGLYLIRTEDDPNYDEVQSSLVTIPTIDENTSDIQYDVQVIPKTVPRESTNNVVKKVLQTGVDHNIFIFAGIGIIVIAAGVMLGNSKKRK